MKQKIVLIVAVVVGLLAAILTRMYLVNKDHELSRLKQRFLARHGEMAVLCYSKDVPGGTVLTRAEIGVIEVPASGLRGQALTEADLGTVLNRRITLGHRRGDTIFWGDIEGGNPHSGGLAATVKRQMRAVSINASGAAAVSGMVKPNDHVDVIGTFALPRATREGEKTDLVTSTILQNVLVLATGKTLAQSAQAQADVVAGYTTVTLEVTPREAEMLVFAEQIRGRLTLTLRNRNDTSFEKELPQVNYEKIRGEIESLNQKRQEKLQGFRR